MEDENIALDADLDAELQQQLDAINSKTTAETSGVPVEPKTTEETSQDNSVETTASPVVTEEAKAEGSDTQTEQDEYDFKAPIRGKFESEDSYQVRLEIAEKIRERNLAKDQGEKDLLQKELKALRSELSNIGLNEKFTRSHQTNENSNDASPDDSNALLKQAEAIVEKKFFEKEITSTLNNFVSTTKELQNEVTRDVFFDFVESNFNWQGKSGSDLSKVLTLAKEAFFRKPETLQERVLKSANVQEKVNAMQFPGGSASKAGLSPEMQASFDELKSQGLSDDQAMTLISD